MNRSNTSILTLLVLLLFGTFAASTSHAMPRTGRLVEGAIQNVDAARGRAEIQHDGQIKVITWSKKVKIYKDGKEVTAMSIRNGDHARVWRHVPFFGPPFVRRLNLTSTHSK